MDTIALTIINRKNTKMDKFIEIGIGVKIDFCVI